jgi:hypothetical protein
MLHVFHVDVAKVDRDIIHVASRQGKRAQVEAVPWPQVVPTCAREARRARIVPTERRGRRETSEQVDRRASNAAVRRGTSSTTENIAPLNPGINPEKYEHRAKSRT